MASQDQELISAIKNDRNAEYKENIELWRKWRAAINSNLGGKRILKQPKLSRVKQGRQLEVIDVDNLELEKQNRQTYLYRISHLESDVSYFFRQLHNIDFGDSEKVVRIYTGHSMREEAQVNANINNEVDEKIKNNIDNDGNTLNHFAQSIYNELYGMGKAITFNNATTVKKDKDGRPLPGTQQTVLPWATVIKRENLLDWAEDKDKNDGSLRFAKWQGTIEAGGRFQSKQVKTITAVDKDEMIILIEQRRGVFGDPIRLKNPIGEVPVRIATLGPEARPVIETVCEMQVAVMNAYSILAQLLRNQVISILVTPSGSKLELLTSTTKIEVPAGGSGQPVYWAGYPVQTLDGHFTNIKFLKEAIRDNANLRDKGVNMAEAALSKKWDFLDTETILTVGVKAHDQIMTQTLRDFAKFNGKTNLDEIFYKNSDDFNHLSLKEKLEQAEIIKTLPIGVTAKKSTLKVIRDMVVQTLSELQIKVSDQEIAAAVEMAANRAEMVTSNTVLNSMGGDTDINENDDNDDT